MKTPFSHPEEFVTFAILIDNEVVHHLTMPITQEMHVAIFSSDPKFVSVPPNNQPPLGSKWDGEKFNVSVD